MNSTGIWESGELELVTSDPGNEHQELRTSSRRITALKTLTLQLLREVQSIGEIKVLEIDRGLDFYNEIARFEIDLITRALVLTGVHQAHAAKLLNLKVTTLNSKIKSYNINPKSFTGVGSAEGEEVASTSGQTGFQNQDGIVSVPNPSFA